MPYIPADVVSRAKQMDLYYCTREHDSLKISNGKWYWFSQSIGGRSALDYLIKVRGTPFKEAVETIVGRCAAQPVVAAPRKEPPKRSLLLPEANGDGVRVKDYLTGRGIDQELISYCLSAGKLYESRKYHNAVFVGQDSAGNSRYVNLRGIDSAFKGEASGSDKRFSFSIPARDKSGTLHLFESAIDLLSFATMCKQIGRDWRQDHLLSLAGVYRPRKELRESSMPLALTQYLKDHPGIRKIVLRLDNDYAGRTASQALQTMLSGSYEVSIRPPPEGKDYNDCLCMRLGIPITKTKERSAER